MSVEVSISRFKRVGHDITEKSYIIRPGEWQKIPVRGRIAFATFCDIDNRVGTVWVRGNRPSRILNLIRYEEFADKIGESINIDESPKVTLMGRQYIAIISRSGPKRQITVSFNYDEIVNPENFSPMDLFPIVMV